MEDPKFSEFNIKESSIESCYAAPLSQLVLGDRGCEKGMLRDSKPLTFAITAEGFPIWLLALNSEFVRELHLRGRLSDTEVISKMSGIVQQSLMKLGLHKVKFVNNIKSNVDVELFSGSLAFLCEKTESVTGAAFLCHDTSWKSRTVPRTRDVIRWKVLGPGLHGSGAHSNLLLGFKIIISFET